MIACQSAPLPISLTRISLNSYVALLQSWIEPVYCPLIEEGGRGKGRGIAVYVVSLRGPTRSHAVDLFARLSVSCAVARSRRGVRRCRIWLR